MASTPGIITFPGRERAAGPCVADPPSVGFYEEVTYVRSGGTTRTAQRTTVRHPQGFQHFRVLRLGSIASFGQIAFTAHLES